MRTMQLLAPLVDARLACGEIGGRAKRRPGGLAELAAELGHRASVVARADLAAARVALARGRLDDAAEAARRALAEFGPARRCRWRSARRALELARALAPEAPDIAREEARAAFATFRELGAAARDGRRRRASCASSDAGTAGRDARRPAS